MGGGSKESSSSQSASPWAGSQPFLTGTIASPGVLGEDGKITGVMPAVNGALPSAYNQFQNGSWSPQQQGAVDQFQQYLQSQQPGAANQQNYGNALLAGGNNAIAQPVGAIQGQAPVTAGQVGTGQVGTSQVSAQNVNAQAVDPTQAFSSLGSVNPTQALEQQLSGQVNNPYLDQQIAGIGTDISNNLNRNIMPGLRSEAVANGQYGSSRQGIAEGLATQGATQQLANQSANLRSAAYEAAQTRQGTAASNLSNLGLTNSTNNANRDLAGQTTNAANQLTASQANAANALQASQANAANGLNASNANASNALNADQFNATLGSNTNQFNANLGLQNNAQAITNSANTMNNYVAGSNILNQGQAYANNLYQQQLTNLGLGNQYNWSNLANFSNIINAPSGGTAVTTSSGGGASPLQSAAGGAATGAAIGGPWGAAIGGGIGLLSSM